MYINTAGLVLREAAYQDSGKILTVLTQTEGKLTVSARGVKRKNSKLAAAAQFLVYSEMTLFQSRDRWTLTEARPIEMFAGVSREVTRYALGAYFTQLVEAVSDEDAPNPELLSLALNALFVLSEGKHGEEHIKAALELRLMCVSGFAPRLDGCAVCGRDEPDEPVFDLEGGAVLCRKCAGREALALDRASFHALRHIASCDPKRVFSFQLPPDAQRRLSRAAERYALTHLDRRFGTLDFYKSLING